MSTETMNPPELKTLQIEIDGEIATLTLNRPDAFNAMSPETDRRAAVAMAWLADRAQIRALIVTGAGKAFCAGGDITWFRKGIEEADLDISADVRRGAEALHPAIIDLRRIEVPSSPRSTARRPAPASPSPSPATSGSPPRAPSSPPPTAASAPRRTAA